MIAGLGAARRLAKKYGPIDYRGAAKKIQKAYRDYKKRKTSKKKTFSANKRLKKGSFPRARIGQLMGVHGRKGAKPKRLVGVRRRLDKTLTSEQSMVNYVGFNIAGTSDDILQTYCMMLVKSIMIRAGAPIDSWDGNVHHEGRTGLEHNRIWKIRLTFHRDRHTDADRSESIISFGTNETPTSLAAAISVQINDQYNSGFLPSCYSLIEYDGTADGRTFYENTSWGDDMVEFTSTTYVNVQNITPADNDSTNINDVNANPLSARVYDFKHPFVKFNEEYLREIEGSVEEVGGVPTTPFDQLHDMQTTVRTTDIISTEYLRKDGVIGNELATAFKKPPRGAAVFANLDGAKAMSLPPGGYQVIKRYIKTSASTRRFIAGIYKIYNGSQDWVKTVNRPTVNKSLLLAFEPTVRSQSNELVKVICNRKIVHDCVIRRKKPSNVPVHNVVEDLVTIA